MLHIHLHVPKGKQKVPITCTTLNTEQYKLLKLFMCIVLAGTHSSSHCKRGPGLVPGFVGPQVQSLHVLLGSARVPSRFFLLQSNNMQVGLTDHSKLAVWGCVNLSLDGCLSLSALRPFELSFHKCFCICLFIHVCPLHFNLLLLMYYFHYTFFWHLFIFIITVYNWQVCQSHVSWGHLISHWLMVRVHRLTTC